MKKKDINILKILFLLFLFLMTIILISRYFILKKENELLTQKYSLLTKNIEEKTNFLIQSKKNATLAIALSLSENEKIKEIILKENYNYDLNILSEKLKKSTDFKNVWFQIIDKEGISLYRNWTSNKNDKIKKYRLDLQEVLKKPEEKSTISVGIYDITFKSMVPLYENNEFIGILEVITHFNSIMNNLRDNDLVEPIILVDDAFSEQLKQNAFSKLFLKNYYVANLDVSEELLSYLKHTEIKEYLEIENFVIKGNKLIINIPIVENKFKLANILLFKDLSQIDISEIKEFKKNAFLYLGFSLLFLCLLIFVIAYYLYSKRLKELNQILQQTVSDEIIKNNEKNKILFQQNKMAAMGEMIGNIAHQWRQPLSVITTAASSIKLKKEYGILNDKEYDEFMDYIIDTANYLSNTIDDFRYYFSPNKNKNYLNTKKLIDKSLKLVNISFSEEKINIIKNIENIDILSFENELLQVIINILNNVKDELSKKDISEKRYLFIDLYKKDENLIMEIKDNAGGVKPEIIDRIFEPYFTTKHKSKGTGIGLYMCQEIIVKHIKGNIEVSNSNYEYNGEKLLGALFKITIPLE
jgi:signal transduction histidine kinase